MLLYINGQLADLTTGQVIAQTKQVNDLNSLENRQAGYTNKFKLPKTANNIRIMNFLTLAGNNSNIPYQKNECSLYSDAGECFVYKGWAVITDGGDAYEAVVYDGIIDLYKALEGKTLADLKLQNYDHDKSISAVRESWLRNAPYFYLLADYNGNTGDTQAGKINIDYLIPAMSVEFLWWQIMAVFNVSFSGSIFDDPEFKSLYLTFPKGMETVASSQLLFEGNNYSFVSALSRSDIGEYNEFPKSNKFFAKLNSTLTGQGISSSNNIQLKVEEAGNYIVEITGNLNTRNLPELQTEGLKTNADVYLSLNATGTNALNASRYGSYVAANQPNGSSFSNKRTLYLSAGDTLSVVVAPTTVLANATFVMPNANQSLTVKLTRITFTKVDFTDGFAEFSIRDFIKETLYHFGLTMYKDKFSDSYNFLTLKELLEESEPLDWSSKFIRKVSENYIYGSYARQNWFRYKYNDKEASHSDGYFEIANENLEESKTVLSSVLYSPERLQTTFLGKPSPVFKFWEKELTEATDDEPASIDYKPLDKRFFFVKAIEEVRQTPVHLYSDAYPQDEDNNSAVPFKLYRAGFDGLTFSSVVRNYYEPFRRIVNKSRIVTAELWLSDTDIAHFDFKKRYYIEQLGSYFVMNKINNYVPGKPVKCELVRTENNPEDTFEVRITKIVIEAYLVRVFYQTIHPVTGIIVEYDSGSDNWTALPFSGSSPATFRLPQGDYKIQVRANGKLSNNVPVNVPDVRTINIA